MKEKSARHIKQETALVKMATGGYILPQLYGLDRLKQALHYLLLMQDEDPRDQLSIAIVAEPGCGKTEIARWLAIQSKNITVIDDFDIDFFELEELSNLVLLTRPCHDHFEGNRILGDEIPIPRSIMTNMDLVFIIRDTQDGQEDVLKMQYFFGKQAVRVIDHSQRCKNLAPKLSARAQSLLESHLLQKRKAKGKRYHFKLLKTLFKLSKANAKARGSDLVEEDDVHAAIELLEHCYSIFHPQGEAAETRDVMRHVITKETDTWAERIRSVLLDEKIPEEKAQTIIDRIKKDSKEQDDKNIFVITTRQQ